eukprot:CAMPEP_0114362442 /NCGR_PEP_ID=MMETSP0101-20121206/25662_1 /TAXON_ID=38822 ORGANISM="Pteridomonas danica, Strain PT" /NCGR_SAMPLE_ID=MMETSP0101 /ASSEMBLY_ACC=CAM_ASM_000211 /LENGTH=234 /DNA_ID=CAMNT_0001508271 /DNA_START=84 /DNA_END=786 /DNA_ORIENTATION=+
MALSSGSTLTCKICGANMNHDRSIYKHNDTYHRASLKMSQFGELDENDDLFYCVLCDFYVERKFEKAHHLCRYHNEMRKQRSITDEDMKIHQVSTVMPSSQKKKRKEAPPQADDLDNDSDDPANAQKKKRKEAPPQADDLDNDSDDPENWISNQIGEDGMDVVEEYLGKGGAADMAIFALTTHHMKALAKEPADGDVRGHLRELGRMFERHPQWASQKATPESKITIMQNIQTM